MAARQMSDGRPNRSTYIMVVLGAEQ